MRMELDYQDAPLEADLSNPLVREDLTPAAIKATSRIAEEWELSASQTSRLLGINERTWYRIKKSPPKSLSQDTLTRISALIGIYKGLRLIFSEPLVDTWPTRPNSNPLFAQKSPVKAMIEGGIPMMVRTRNYIDALRGGL